MGGMIISGIGLGAAASDPYLGGAATPIYRGLNGDHVNFESAVNGEAWPGDILGHADAEAHAAGLTEDSRLISWTTDKSVALRFMMNGDENYGVVLESTLEEQAGKIVPGPDILGESEVLVRGIVSGAEVEGFSW